MATNYIARILGLEFEIWSFCGAWSLVLGAWCLVLWCADSIENSEEPAFRPFPWSGQTIPFTPNLVPMSCVESPLIIANRQFRSRLILGTGKFSSAETMRDAL